MAVLDPLCEFMDVLRGERYVGAHYLLCSFGDSPSIVLVCRCILDVATPDQVSSDCWEIGGLAVRRGWVKVDELMAALQTPCGAPFQLDGATLHLDAGGSPFSWSTLRDHLRASEDGMMSTRIFSGQGRSIPDIVGGYPAFTALGRRLPACPRPFRDWKALSTFLGLDQSISDQRYSSFEIVLPVYARIVGRWLSPAGELVVRVESAEPLSELALVVTPDDPDDEPIRISHESWKQHDPPDGTFLAQGSCTTLFGPATIQLIAHGQEVHSVRVGIPTLASRAHVALDENGWLRNLLGLRPGAEGKTRSDGFELAIVNLLSLAGFQTVHYGHASHASFPDLIAIISETCMLVGECTIEAPDRDKLLTLAQRADAIRDRAQGSQQGVALLRAVFTPRPRSEVAPSVLELAESDASVAVIAQDQIAKLLEMVMRGEDPDAVVGTLLGWVSQRGPIRL